MTRVIQEHPSILFNIITLFLTMGCWTYIFGARMNDMEHLNRRMNVIESTVKRDHDILIRLETKLNGDKK